MFLRLVASWDRACLERHLRSRLIRDNVTELLRNRFLSKKSLLLLLPFYLAGLLTLCVVYRIYDVNLARLLILAPSVHDEICATAAARWTIALASIPAGMALITVVLIVQRLQNKPRPDHNCRAPRDG